MASWSKRRTTKGGNQGQRVTRTTNSNGTSTYSTSKRTGNRRTTTTTSSTGKIKEVVTEHHPTLGTRRTVRTLNPTIKTSKPKKSSRIKPIKYVPVKVSRTYKNPYASEISEHNGMLGWVFTAVLLLVFGMPWYVWLIYFSVFLKFKVAFFK